jgi:hypothetical protein
MMMTNGARIFWGVAGLAFMMYVLTAGFDLSVIDTLLSVGAATVTVGGVVWSRRRAARRALPRARVV